MARTVFFLLLQILSVPCRLWAHTDGDSTRILFVGNSLTYSNDLPALVKELGEQDGKTIRYTSFLFPNYALEDHWNEGRVEDEIEKGGYDFVVMQQGPSAAPESQLLLLEYVKKFSEVCRRVNTRPVVYMVWPSKARSFDMDNVIRSHSNAAEKTGSLLAPAGLAWKYAWQEDETLPLYSADNFHPSVMGTVLAAMTIYASLWGNEHLSFISRQKASWQNSISQKNFEILQRAALKALKE